jgi:hypothetical protein
MLLTIGGGRIVVTTEAKLAMKHQSKQAEKYNTHDFKRYITKISAKAVVIIFLATRSVFSQGVSMEFGGLAIGKDEFDDLVAHAMGCPNQYGKQMIDSINEREGTQLKIRRCLVEVTMKKFLEKKIDEKILIAEYLQQRNARCTRAQSGTHCRVIRDVRLRTHTGDRKSGSVSRDVFTIDIELDSSDRPVDVKIDRETILPGEDKG